MFYYLPKGQAWISQFDRTHTKEDSNTFFENLSIRFMEYIETIRGYGILELVLTDEQMDRFDAEYTQRFDEARLAFSGEMDSSVIRQAHNCLRVMSVIATLRMLADPERKMLEEAKKMMQNPEREYVNLKYLHISDEDFGAAMHIFRVLYHHNVHLLSFVNSSEVSRRQLSEPLLILEMMPDSFTTKQWMDACEEKCINENTAKWWLGQLKEKKMVLNPGRGQYEKIKFNKEVSKQNELSE